MAEATIGQGLGESSEVAQTSLLLSRSCECGAFFTSSVSCTVLTVCCVNVVILGGEPTACLVVFLLYFDSIPNDILECSKRWQTF